MVPPPRLLTSSLGGKEKKHNKKDQGGHSNVREAVTLAWSIKESALPEIYVPPFTLEILQQRKCLRDKQKKKNTPNTSIFNPSIHPSISIYLRCAPFLFILDTSIHPSIRPIPSIHQIPRQQLNYCRYCSSFGSHASLYFSKGHSVNLILKDIVQDMSDGQERLSHGALATGNNLFCENTPLYPLLTLLCFSKFLFWGKFFSDLLCLCSRAPTKA